MKRAADQGNDSAQLILAMRYEFGEGVATDYIAAYEWLTIASNQGNEKARSRRKNLEDSLPKEKILEIQSNSSRWKPSPEKLKFTNNELTKACNLAKLQVQGHSDDNQQQ